MLDDPYVSADTKQKLLGSYLMEGGDDSGEVKQYTDRYKPDVDLNHHKGTDDLYQDAKQESDQAGYHDRQVEGQGHQNATSLDGLAAPAAGGGGGGTSGEIFGLAKPPLQGVRHVGPVAAKAPDAAPG